VTYACPVCGNDLSEHGTAGMTCMYGHHFLATDIKNTAERVRRVRGREFRVPAWVPGAVLGGMALLVSIVDVVLEVVT
jgi:hypothetical protein